MEECVREDNSEWGLHRTVYRETKHVDEYYEYNDGIITLILILGP